MKTFSVVALALATMVSAQSLADIPSCAQTCIKDAVKQATSCDVADVACVCAEMDKVQSAAVGCILAGCGQDKAINEVLPAAKKLCANAPTNTSGASKPTKKPSGTATASATATVPTQGPSTTSSTTPPTVTAGAAAFAPVGGLAALVAVLAL